MTKEETRELDLIICQRIEEVYEDVEAGRVYGENFTRADMINDLTDVLGDWCYDKGYRNGEAEERIVHWVKRYA